MICKSCNEDKGDEFYSNDKKCKDCRKKLARENRAKNVVYYRKYDRDRFKNDPKVKDRIIRYLSSPNGKAAKKRASDKWKKSNPVKRAANVILGNAVRDGKIKKPCFCSACGGTGSIHGHHDDYAFPLVVRWLCSGCHNNWHKENGEGLNA